MLNHGVESTKLSGVITVSSLQLSQFESSTFFSALAETTVEQELPALKNFLWVYSMNCSVCGEVVFKSVSAILRKKDLLSNYNFATTKLSSHWAWVEYTIKL